MNARWRSGSLGPYLFFFYFVVEFPHHPWRSYIPPSPFPFHFFFFIILSWLFSLLQCMPVLCIAASAATLLALLARSKSGNSSTRVAFLSSTELSPSLLHSYSSALCESTRIPRTVSRAPRARFCLRVSVLIRHFAHGCFVPYIYIRISRLSLYLYAFRIVSIMPI